MSVRILVLEDDAEMRQMLVSVLSDQGYAVTEAARGEEAVELARNQTFDLIVADIRMEGMDGLEAVEKAQQAQPQLGSLMVSGYASDEQMSRYSHLKLGGFLKKPFKLRDLLDLITQMVEQKRKFEAERSQTERLEDALEWALRSLLKSLDGSGDLARLGQLVERLSARLGMDPSVGRQLALGAQLRSASGLVVPRDFLSECGVLETLSTLLKQPTQGSSFLEFQLVELAQEAARGEVDLEAQSWDPALKEAYRSLLAVPTPAPPPRSQPSARSLLALAQTLAETGDREGARRAFLELAGGEDPRLAQEASLGLARLAHLSEEELWSAVTAVVERGREVGPVAAALSELECGLLLRQRGSGHAVDLLSACRERLHGLGLAQPAGLAELSLLALGAPLPAGQSWERLRDVLLDPGQLDPRHNSWLAPTLLAQAAQRQDGEALARLVQRFPQELAARLDAPDLTAEEIHLLQQRLPQLGFLPAEIQEALQRSSLPACQRLGLELTERQRLAPAIKVRLLSFGLFTVIKGSDTLSEQEWRTQKTKYLLAYLASRERAVHEEQVLELFWPDDLKRGRKSLTTSVFRLRSALGSHEAVVREHEFLSLNPSVFWWHDYQQFQEACRDSDPLKAALRATQLYRAPYLDGCFMDWALLTRTRLEEQVVDFHLYLAQHYLGASQPRESLEQANRALDWMPYRQDVQALAMQALLDLKQPQEAIKRFEKFDKTLRREFEVEPNTELLRLFHQARLTLG